MANAGPSPATGQRGDLAVLPLLAGSGSAVVDEAVAVRKLMVPALLGVVAVTLTLEAPAAMLPSTQVTVLALVPLTLQIPCQTPAIAR